MLPQPLFGTEAMAREKRAQFAGIREIYALRRT